MTLTRRDFLTAGAALVTASAIARRSATADVATDPDVPTIRAQRGGAWMVPGESLRTEIWGYEGLVPGPDLRLPRGGRLIRRFVNELPQPSTIHWHGIRLQNAMDGVPELTQAVVQPGEEFLYDFTVPDAGTFWYHSHNQSWEQVARGLYGAIVVDEPDPPEVDRDDVLLIDDWRLTAEGEIDESFGAMSDWSHAGRLGNWLTVNGNGAWHAAVGHNSRLRLRLVNTANARVFTLTMKGLEGWMVAQDGQPLDAPVPANWITLAPGQRTDLIVDVMAMPGEEGSLAAVDRNQVFRLATFMVAGESRTVRLGEPEPLPANPNPALGSIETARRVTLTMSGGAMGRMTGATLSGQYLGMADLVERGKVWALNGSADMPDKPLIDAALGETVRLTIVNETAFPHGMHLHGHHFRQVFANGSTGPWRDTILLQGAETLEVAFVADNPGDWLLHCHMLEHAVAGMNTWIRVSG